MIQLTDITEGGYYLAPNGTIIQLTLLDLKHYLVDGVLNLRPIPLTDGWLKRFEFERIEFDYWTKEFDRNKSITLNEDFYLLDIDLPLKFEFVHELQQQYYIVAKKQLTIKT